MSIHTHEDSIFEQHESLIQHDFYCNYYKRSFRRHDNDVFFEIGKMNIRIAHIDVPFRLEPIVESSDIHQPVQTVDVLDNYVP